MCLGDMIGPIKQIIINVGKKRFCFWAKLKLENWDTNNAGRKIGIMVIYNRKRT